MHDRLRKDHFWGNYVFSAAHFIGIKIELIMMTPSNGNICRVTGPMWGEYTGHRWIPLTKASNVEQTVVQIAETTVIWDAIALIMTPM